MLSQKSQFSLVEILLVPPPFPPIYPSPRRAKSIPSPGAIFGGSTIFEASVIVNYFVLYCFFVPYEEVHCPVEHRGGREADRRVEGHVPGGEGGGGAHARVAGPVAGSRGIQERSKIAVENLQLFFFGGGKLGILIGGKPRATFLKYSFLLCTYTQFVPATVGFFFHFYIVSTHFFRHPVAK